MGNFLWLARRDDYFFSIRGGVERGLPADATCPSLRVAIHLSELKRAAIFNKGVDYHQEARGIMAAGLCRAGRLRNLLSRQEQQLCARNPYSSTSLLLRADDVVLQSDPQYGWMGNASHCGRRSTKRLLADYDELVAGGALGGGPQRSLRRWLRSALSSNASGEYSYDSSRVMEFISERLEVNIG
eukprot:TRINITY_DN45132_c0_g1_i1.p1 TRINITY_DN45132_c0_g1~~TRINITY_DN45132_c0_g1_i1.p1  ORF type:complete len:193 (+),score=34.52 TRINITY_DN45132_c0_g1_i1:25-579(+)